MRRFFPETVHIRISRIAGVQLRNASHIFPLFRENRTHFQICGRETLVRHSLQLFHGIHFQLFHQRLREVLTASLRIFHQHSDHAAHIDALCKQSVSRRTLKKRRDLGSAAGLPEHGDIVLISAKRFHIVPDPPERRDNIIRARVAGIRILLPEIRQIAVTQDIEPVVDRNYNHISQPAHIFPLVGDLLNS